MSKNLLIGLIADTRNRALETRAIIKLVGKGKYTEVQALFMIDREMVKIDELLAGYEKALRDSSINERDIWNE